MFNRMDEYMNNRGTELTMPAQKQQIIWTAEDEMEVIEHMAAGKPRANGHIPTVVERIIKLKSWLKYSEKRIWPNDFNLSACQDYARKLLMKIEMEIADKCH